MIRVVFSYGPTCLGPSCPQAELSGTRLAYQSLAFDKTHVFFFFFWYTVYHRPPKISVSILNKILNHKRNHLNLLQLHFGIAFQIISGGKRASPSSVVPTFLCHLTFFFPNLLEPWDSSSKSEKKLSDGRGISDYQFRSLIQSWNGSECHCSACI